MNINKLVLIRHGESQWNYENRFTGWTDVKLTNKGKLEAKKAGKILKKKNFFFDYAYTSFLKRSIETLWIILKEINQMWIPVQKTWKLNERHYGALQGLNKQETEKKYGKKQVMQWRRSFTSIPPALSKTDKRFPKNETKYSKIKYKKIPKTESLKTTTIRVIKYLKKNIFPKLKRNKTIIISAHGNSIRAIIKFLSKLDNDNLIKLNIPNAVPLIYEFNNYIQPIKYYYLYS